MLLDGCFIPCRPAPQGSKRAWARMTKSGKPVAIMQEASAKTQKRFREAAFLVARAEKLCDEPYGGPVLLTVEFRFRRPKSHFGSGKNSDVLKSGTSPFPVSRSIGDLSKLIRCLEDSLTDAGVWVDDSQVVDVSAKKRYGSGDGARVWVSAL